jgi:hypothetical protein
VCNSPNAMAEAEAERPGRMGVLSAGLDVGAWNVCPSLEAGAGRGAWPGQGVSRHGERRREFVVELSGFAMLPGATLNLYPALSSYFSVCLLS